MKQIILDRFLQHAEVISITGKSYRLRNQQPDKKTAKNGKNQDQACQTKDQWCPLSQPHLCAAGVS